MGWIAVIALALAVLGVALLTSRRTGHARRAYQSRRSDRLETAFLRARGQRMTANGIRTDRF